MRRWLLVLILAGIMSSESAAEDAVVVHRAMRIESWAPESCGVTVESVAPGKIAYAWHVFWLKKEPDKDVSVEFYIAMPSGQDDKQLPAMGSLVKEVVELGVVQAWKGIWSAILVQGAGITRMHISFLRNDLRALSAMGVTTIRFMVVAKNPSGDQWIERQEQFSVESILQAPSRAPFMPLPSSPILEKKIEKKRTL